MRVTSALAGLGLAACLPLGCHLMSGVGDLEFAPSGTGAAGTGGLGLTSSSTTDGGAGAGASGGAGGSTGGAAGCLIGLQDPFDGDVVNAALWTELPQNATTGVSGGRFFVQPMASTAAAWGEITSIDSYELAGCAVLVELVQPLNNDGDATTTFSVSNGNYNDSLGLRVRGGELAGRVVAGGVETPLASTPYVDSDHKWLRVREQGGTVYLDTSANGADWVELAQTGAPFYVHQAYVNLGGGSWGGLSANPGEAQFDNVNLPP